MSRVQVAMRRVTQTVRGEALPQTHWERVWRSTMPLPHPRSTRARWERAADLVAVALWTIVGTGFLCLVWMWSS